MPQTQVKKGSKYCAFFSKEVMQKNDVNGAL
jgi:hypothetical protein